MKKCNIKGCDKESKQLAELTGASEAFTDLAEAAIDCKYTQKSLDGMLKRMKAKFPMVRDTSTITVKQTIDEISNKIVKTLDYIDDFAISSASFRDLTIGLGVLIDKKQLLSGEPTQILSIEERRTISELMPYLVTEARRRGITIDVTPDEPTRAI